MERLDAFMARANAAYYAQHDPFRDFTTAPEISQAFGEVLGLWAAVVWQSMGCPDPVQLVECGPGRGTLMADALRATGRAIPAFRAATRVHLVETSARLRAVQARALPAAAWHDTTETVPPGPMILIANEFLDALPIRQFVRRGTAWTERHVAGGAFVERPGTAPAGDRAETAPEGVVVEQCDAARALVAGLARRLVGQGGAALLIDYGPAASAPGDSLQALRDGRPADPLADPGSADLTAHVDFAALAAEARHAGAAVHGPLAQGVFLARLGLVQRSGILARTQKPAQAAALIEAAQRLTEPDRMGSLFKALCLCQPGLAIPPGFEG